MPLVFRQVWGNLFRWRGQTHRRVLKAEHDGQNSPTSGELFPRAGFNGNAPFFGFRKNLEQGGSWLTPGKGYLCFAGSQPMERKSSSVWWTWWWLGLPWISWFLVQGAMQYFFGMLPAPRVGLPHLMPWSVQGLHWATAGADRADENRLSRKGDLPSIPLEKDMHPHLIQVRPPFCSGSASYQEIFPCGQKHLQAHSRHSFGSAPKRPPLPSPGFVR